MTEFIAVDWGTTNRRAYRIEGGRVAAAETDGPGAAAMKGEGYAAEVAGLRERLGDLPVLLSGMVGSSMGWRAITYVNTPASLERIAANLGRIDERIAIVPGVADRAGSDVMRGEEVQILGARGAALVPNDALLCQPGTHCKWVELNGGQITSIRTAITGELFALLRQHSVLAGQLAHPVEVGEAFAEGVTAAGADLLGAIFRVRAAGLLGRRDDRQAASYTSGLLIGSDVGARDVQGRTVYLLADPVLGRLYAFAIEQLGGRAVTIDSTAAFIAGAVAITGLTQ